MNDEAGSSKVVVSVVISLGISFASLAIAVIALWKTSLKPFNLEVVPTGRVVLTTNPQSPGALQSAFLVGLVMTNKGAKLGYVDDVALAVQLDSASASVLLRSLFEQFDDSLNLTQDLPPPKLRAFSSFPLKRGETVIKKILFAPVDPDLFGGFEEKTYSLIPYTVSPGSTWREWGRIKVEVTAEDLRALSTTVATPVEGGGQFVKWIVHSKPTERINKELEALRARLRDQNS